MARRALAAGDTLPLLARLWRDWLSPHRGTLAVVMLLIAVVGAATGLYPALIKAAFDAFDHKDASALTYGPLIVVAVTSVRGFALYGQTVLTNRVVTRVEADMQAALYGHLIESDLAQLGRESPAAFTQRFTTDFAFIKEALTRISTVLLRDVAMLVGLVAALVWMDPLLTLIAAVTVPFVAGPVGRIGKKLRRVSTSTQERMGATASLITESLQGARVAKTYALEGYLKGRAAEALDEVRRLKMKAANARGRLDPLLEVGGGLAVAGVLLLVGQRVMSGDRTVGDFTGYVAALLLAAQPARALGTLNAILQEAAAALRRYFDLIDEAPTIREAPNAAPLTIGAGEVRFEGVRFRYRPDAPALEGIDLTVPAGRRTALVGRSGSGKSSLLNLVPRLYDVTGGRVTVDGQDVRDVTLASLRQAVAVVSQEVVLFDDTVAANIAFGRPGASREQIEAAAEAAAAHGFVSRLPEGYEFRVGPGGGRLSGGERQRISLARAFLKDAPILLLDEATSALDAESERLVQGALERLMQGRTTLVIAHRLSTVRDADLIVVMEAGRIAETGSHGALMEAGGVYAHLHRLQRDEMPA
ncbi:MULTISPECIES: ABC transporter ATP-binding protein [Methylobacterium]|uniref:Lipid A export ATP-binding/permease protein MsbA n=4 Tax=Pseudomonadota TaxID=1224 RepID=A0ABQ4T064_9HYPH|nr:MULTISPECIES: ABC transporter ATP-binding protein [Methylobacterium]PIU04511.1 MAG: ABC transporter permease [Methylobacterium sp. CG09_land_8_20_14_0_10_71_15]PIU12768.1 MAG: ABC transporter permease [Methylobacterium sp. CG08_land_8_20_14_0_20_71_15]GBU19972.1 lipid ABC transporter permease/ATPase [Methylobacterium sp.]GJE08846.1 Lipid A export ATP-binding/permease protein MsbA [Methylobacterium jeotgali]